LTAIAFYSFLQLIAMRVCGQVTAECRQFGVYGANAIRCSRIWWHTLGQKDN